MRILIIFLSVLLLASCNMGRYYARQRAGGSMEIQKSEPVFTSEEIGENTDLNAEEKNVPVYSDSVAFVAEEKKPSFVRTTEQNQIPSPVSNVDETTEDTIYVMSEQLSQAYAAQIANVAAAVFAGLSISYPNFAWVAVPLYFFAGLCCLVGLICFTVAVVWFSKGETDHREKKFLHLWWITFPVTVFIAVMAALAVL